MQNCRARIILLWVLISIVAIPVHAQNVLSREYNIKAVFLFNFTHFIDWPVSTFAEPQSPFIIGILGADPFQSVIDETVAGEMVNGHSIIIQRYPTIKDLKACHILYITEREEGKIKQAIAALANKNILTVSDENNFIGMGGMIRFLTFNNKIKLQVNITAVRAANISISSKLLGLSDIVDGR